MEITVEKITPTKAKMYLENNPKNRHISSPLVEMYAKDIASGQWHMTGDPIRFNGSGALLDGQHRLAAIVSANQPVTCVVIRGLKSVSQDFMDQGRARSLNNVLQMRGTPDANMAAATVQALCKIKHYKLASKKFSMPTLTNMYEKHKNQIAVAVPIINADRPYGLPYGGVTAIYMILSEIMGDPNMAEEFRHVLVTGEPAYKNDPLHIFREKIHRMAQAKTMPHTRNILWTMIAMLNLHMANAPIERKAFKFEIDPQKIDGLNYRRL